MQQEEDVQLTSWKGREEEQQRGRRAENGCGVLTPGKHVQGRILQGSCPLLTGTIQGSKFRERLGIWQHRNLCNYLKNKEERPRQRKRHEIIGFGAARAQGWMQSHPEEVAAACLGVCREGGGGPWELFLNGTAALGWLCCFSPIFDGNLGQECS